MRKERKKPSPISETGLLRAAREYAAWSERNPLTIERTLPSGQVVKERHARPLTWEGFVAHARIDPGLIEATRATSPDIFQAVRALFFDQQYGRAAIREYDPRLVASYFGLAERRQIEARLTITDMSDDELDAELAELMQVVDVTPDARITSENRTSASNHEDAVPLLPAIQDRPK